MMRLKEPDRNFDSTLDECIAGITGNNFFRDKMLDAKPDLLHAGDAYIRAANNGTLYTIAPIDATINRDPVVLGALVKSELVNLYEYYFRNEQKASRATYDRLLNSAHEDCPFCGGIGTPKNLDHFLPKAHFPQFSTLPQNLVPSCRDCNRDGKAESFARIAEDQVIQPYGDHDRFFKMQWIFGECVLNKSNDPVSIRYFVNAPAAWDQVDKERVQKHFKGFGLEKRYSVKAAQLLGTTLAQIYNLQRLGLSHAVICSTILEPGITNAPFINHWQKGMFQALHDYLR